MFARLLANVTTEIRVMPRTMNSNAWAARCDFGRMYPRVVLQGNPLVLWRGGWLEASLLFCLEERLSVIPGEKQSNIETLFRAHFNIT